MVDQKLKLDHANGLIKSTTQPYWKNNQFSQFEVWFTSCASIIIESDSDLSIWINLAFSNTVKYSKHCHFTKIAMNPETAVCFNVSWNCVQQSGNVSIVTIATIYSCNIQSYSYFTENVIANLTLLILKVSDPFHVQIKRT